MKASVSKAESVYRFESKPEDRIRQQIMGFYEARERDNSVTTRRRNAGKCVFDRVSTTVWTFRRELPCNLYLRYFFGLWRYDWQSFVCVHCIVVSFDMR